MGPDGLVIKGLPVYVEKTNGGPKGSVLGKISSDPKRRLRGLFVAVYGYRNLVPCERCEFRYRRDQTSVCDHDETPHVMVPFFGCLSLPGFNEPACANCMSMTEARRCTFNRHERRDWTGAFRASAKREAALPRRKLNLETAPITGDDLAELVATYAGSHLGWTGFKETLGHTKGWTGRADTKSASLKRTLGVSTRQPKRQKSVNFAPIVTAGSDRGSGAGQASGSST